MVVAATYGLQMTPNSREKEMILSNADYLDFGLFFSALQQILIIPARDLEFLFSRSCFLVQLWFGSNIKSMNFFSYLKILFLATWVTVCSSYGYYFPFCIKMISFYGVAMFYFFRMRCYSYYLFGYKNILVFVTKSSFFYLLNDTFETEKQHVCSLFPQQTKDHGSEAFLFENLIT